MNRNTAFGLLATITVAILGCDPTDNIDDDDEPCTLLNMVLVGPNTVAVGSTIEFGYSALGSGACGALDHNLAQWSNSNEAVATMTDEMSDGVRIGVNLTGVSPGTTRVTVTFLTVTRFQDVTVTALPSGTVTDVSTSTPPSVILVGTAFTLTATCRNAGGSPIACSPPPIWSIAPAGIATVSATGLVTPTAPGTATITVTVGGVSSQTTITVVAPPTNFGTTLAGGTFHTCGLTPAGAAYCWGSNAEGSLGDGTGVDRLTPTLVAGGHTFVTISSYGSHTCALTPAGKAYCWGANVNGQLGDGTTTFRASPTPVSGNLTFISISAGITHTCGIATGGAAWCWGANSLGAAGALGTGNETNSTIPVPVTGGQTFQSIATGYLNQFAFTCGLTVTGGVSCWGANNLGQLGIGSNLSHLTTPAPINGVPPFASIAAGGSHACSLTAGGVAYCWGDNSVGALGDNTTINRTMPTQVVGGDSFASLDVGTSHSCARTAAGSVRCWGFNSNGQLGDGTIVRKFVPTPVVGGNSFLVLSTGAAHTCGLTASGAAYCWGLNFVGAIGDGTKVDRHAPVPVLGNVLFKVP